MTTPVTRTSKAQQQAAERTARQERADSREGQLAHQFGFRLARKDLQDPLSTAVHEASHLMVCLSLGIGVARAVVRGDWLREHGLRGQVLSYQQAARVAWDAGALVRLVPTFEPVVPREDWNDLRQELARMDAAWVRAA